MSDLSPEARSIVAGGRHGDEPTASDRARVRGAVMRAIAAGGAAAAGTTAGQAAAAGSAGAKATMGLALKITAAIALGAAALTGAIVAVGPTPAPPPAASSSRPIAASPSAVSSDTAPPPAAPSPAEDAPAKIAEPSAPATSAAPLAPPPKAARRAAPPGPTSAASAAPAEDPLDAETRRLREAHGALKEGDPARALALLDEQSAAYEKGQLREERAAARVLALCKLGRTEEARAAAARFLRDSPDSPLADRVRGSCASSR